MLVLLADGDEALLALKIAEGVNAAIRGLWRLASFVPLRVFPVQRRLATTGAWPSRFTALAAVGVLIWLLRNDVSVMSFGLVLKAIVGALVAPGVRSARLEPAARASGAAHHPVRVPRAGPAAMGGVRLGRFLRASR